MSEFSINTEKALSLSQDLILQFESLKNQEEMGRGVDIYNSLDGKYSEQLKKRIDRILDSVLDEATRMNSMADALGVILNKYKEADRKPLDNIDSQSNSSAEGTDKRNWWQKFWDWLFRKEPDEKKATNDEQEKAADLRIKQRMWNVLQNEKYSQDNWKNSSLDERKQILQDYMNELISIYGLKHVKARISWEKKQEEKGSVEMGNYLHANHTVTINETVLTDSISGINSYALLETVAHELRHAYQHEAIDHPTDYVVSQETIQKWKENFEKYIRPENDMTGYWNQPVEVDARDFQVNRDQRIYAS